MKVIPVTHRAQ